MLSWECVYGGTSITGRGHGHLSNSLKNDCSRYDGAANGLL